MESFHFRKEKRHGLTFHDIMVCFQADLFWSVCWTNFQVKKKKKKTKKKTRESYYIVTVPSGCFM